MQTTTALGFPFPPRFAPTRYAPPAAPPPRLISHAYTPSYRRPVEPYHRYQPAIVNAEPNAYRERFDRDRDRSAWVASRAAMAAQAAAQQAQMYAQQQQQQQMMPQQMQSNPAAPGGNLVPAQNATAANDAASAAAEAATPHPFNTKLLVFGGIAAVVVIGAVVAIKHRK